jgi:hypothetical protein
MAQLKLDPSTGDLAVEAGGFADVDGHDEIRQHLDIRVKVIRGEIAYDTESGVPMIEEVAAKGTAPDRIAAIYRETILETPGVLAILETPTLELNADRLLELSFRASTDTGELVFSQPVTVQPIPEVT